MSLYYRLQAVIDFSEYNEVPHNDLQPVPSFVDLRASLDSTSAENSPIDSGASTPAARRMSARSLSPMRPMIPESLRSRRKGSKEVDIDPVQLMDGDHFVWVSKRRRKSKAERAKYDAEGEVIDFAQCIDAQS